MTTQIPTQDQIAQAAYFIWLAEGQPEGCADQHWNQAVEALKAPAKARKTRKPAAKAAAKPATRKAPAKTAANSAAPKRAAAEAATTEKKTTRARKTPAKAKA